MAFPVLPGFTYDGVCACRLPPRQLSRMGAHELVNTAGWLCVHCGRGHYRNGRCSSCRATVTPFAAIPRGLRRRAAA